MLSATNYLLATNLPFTTALRQAANAMLARSVCFKFNSIYRIICIYDQQGICIFVSGANYRPGKGS